jgi:hypothetical protein
MNIEVLLNDKNINPKAKTEALAKFLLENKISLSNLIEFAAQAKDSPKATCIESIEFATKINPSIANIECLEFVSKCLTAKAPRVKWESAKVIGNIAQLFPDKIDSAIVNLLINTAHDGTVVRWCAAFALGEIIKSKHTHNKVLLANIEAICEREEKNSIKKIYTTALKKILENVYIS